MDLKARAPFLLFLSAVGLIFFLNLGSVPLFEPDEGRYGEMALHMSQSGDWMTPRQNGIPHFHKPPLSSWFVASSFRLFGPSEWSARLPGVLLSFLVLLGVVSMGGSLFGGRAGLLAGWILFTTTLYMIASRLVTPDIALTFFTFAAMFAFSRLFFGTRRKLFFFYMAMVCLGLAMFTKGPVGWMITLLPAVAFAVWKKKGWGIPAIHWFLGITIFLIISFSWYLWICVQYPQAFDYFVLKQLGGRIGKGGMGHVKKIYYYLIVLPLAFLPWTLCLPSAFRCSWSRKSPWPDGDRTKTHFLWLWALLPFLLFSLFKSKLATYVVPLFPPLAMIAGVFLDRFLKGEAPFGKFLKGAAALLLFFPVILAVAGLTVTKVKPDYVSGIPLWVFGSIGLLVVAAEILIFQAFIRKDREKFLAVLLFFLCGLSVLGFSGLPSLQYKNAKVFAQKVLDLAKPGDVVLMFNRNYASFPFYLGRRVIMIGIDRDLEFARPEDLRGFLYRDHAALKDFLDSGKRIFVMTDNNGYEKAQGMTAKPLVVLLRQKKALLFSTAAESAG